MIVTNFTEGNTSISLTDKVITIVSENNVKKEYDIKDVVVKGISNIGFLDPRHVPYDSVDVIQFEILSTGEIFEFEGEGIDEFHKQVIDLMKFINNSK